MVTNELSTSAVPITTGSRSRARDRDSVVIPTAEMLNSFVTMQSFLQVNRAVGCDAQLRREEQYCGTGAAGPC